MYSLLKMRFSIAILVYRSVPFRELTYPTLGKGQLSSNILLGGDMRSFLGGYSRYSQIVLKHKKHTSQHPYQKKSNKNHSLFASSQISLKIMGFSLPASSHIPPHNSTLDCLDGFMLPKWLICENLIT